MVRLESVGKVYYECRHDIVEKFIICKSRINLNPLCSYLQNIIEFGSRSDTFQHDTCH